MGFFKNLSEALEYIRKYGWGEYRAARNRYDEREKKRENSKFKYTKSGEVAMMKALKKRK